MISDDYELHPLDAIKYLNDFIDIISKNVNCVSFYSSYYYEVFFILL